MGLIARRADLLDTTVDAVHQEMTTLANELFEENIELRKKLAAAEIATDQMRTAHSDSSRRIFTEQFVKHPTTLLKLLMDVRDTDWDDIYDFLYKLQTSNIDALLANVTTLQKKLGKIHKHRHRQQADDM